MQSHYADKINKWKRWAEAIHEEVSELWLRQYVWNELREIVRDNPQLNQPSLLYEWLPAVYTSTQASANRRMTDTDPNVISLANLISEIGCNQKIADEHIEEVSIVCVSGEKVRINKKIPDTAADLCRLIKAAQPVKKYVDKRIAHLDSNAAKMILYYDDLNTACQVLQDLTIKYYGFLFNSNYSVSSHIAFDWKAIFRSPWIEPDRPH